MMLAIDHDKLWNQNLNMHIRNLYEHDNSFDSIYNTVYAIFVFSFLFLIKWYYCGNQMLRIVFEKQICIIFLMYWWNGNSSWNHIACSFVRWCSHWFVLILSSLSRLRFDDSLDRYLKLDDLLLTAIFNKVHFKIDSIRYVLSVISVIH